MNRFQYTITTPSDDDQPFFDHELPDIVLDAYADMGAKWAYAERARRLALRATRCERLLDWLAFRLMDVAAYVSLGVWIYPVFTDAGGNLYPLGLMDERKLRRFSWRVCWGEVYMDGWRPGRYV